MRSRHPAAGFIAAALMGVAESLQAQSTDLIEGGRLEGRGVVFESPLFKKFSSMGTAVGLGDIDGDGFADILIVVQTEPDALGNIYAAVLVKGREFLDGRHTVPGDLASTVVLRSGMPLAIPAIQAFGPSGDLDGDGLADLLLSFPYYPSVDGRQIGKGFLVFGDRSLEGEHLIEEVGSSIRGIVFTSSDPEHDWIGRGMADIGDFDGDGQADLAVAAPGSTNLHGEVLAGILFVLLDVRNLPPEVDLAEVSNSIPGFRIHGNPRILPPETAAIVGYGTIGFFGLDISRAGDFDGDGRSDILVTEPDADFRPAYLILGRVEMPPVTDIEESASIENVTVFSGMPDGYLSGQTAGIDDLDGDGRTEIVTGIPRHSYRPFVEGDSRSYLFRGTSNALREYDLSPAAPAGVTTTFQTPGSVDLFGTTVSPAGDMNADGLSDFAIGATRASVGGQRDAGEAYVIFGKKDYGLEVRLGEGFDGIRIQGENTGNNLGAGASPAGDFNGDGGDDLLVLAPQSGIAEDYSRAYLIYGTGRGPAPLRLYRVEPSEGRIRGGTTVKLRGSGFAEGARVALGSLEPSSVRFVTPSEIHITTPPGDRPGFLDVSVTVGGSTVMIPSGFEYTPDFPQIDVSQPGKSVLVIDGPDGYDRSLGSSQTFGDLTGDGIDDFIMTSSHDEGVRVTVVRGGPGLPTRLPVFGPSERVTVIRWLDPLVTSVRAAMLGDVNGDGIRDLGLGRSSGVAWILFGRRELPAEIIIEDALFDRTALRLDRSGVTAGGRNSIAFLVPLGDTSGDGLDDFAIGFSTTPGFAPLAGEILVLEGRRAWPEEYSLDAPSLVFARIEGSVDEEELGAELAAAGDVNGDGFVDILATGKAVAGGGQGRVFVLFGGPGLPGDLDAESYVEQGGGTRIDLEDGFRHADWFHVSSAGDTNGDGLADVLIGVEDGGTNSRGFTYLVPGSRDLPQVFRLLEGPTTQDGVLRLFGANPETQSARLCPAGDFDADGLADFVVASQFNLRVSPPGPWTATVILGTRTPGPPIDLGRPGGRGFVISGKQASQINPRAREAGDLNGDGQPDFALAESLSFPDARPGHVYIIFGPYGGSDFIRGDTNFDERIEISDAVSTLAYLFLGAAAPVCLDAADADDDGRLDLSDAVRVLNFLFLGGTAPEAPHPDPGPDPTDDALSCRGF